VETELMRISESQRMRRRGGEYPFVRLVRRLLNAFRASTRRPRRMRRALAMDGTCTGEHGIGRHRISRLGEEFGDAAVDLMRRLRTAWDPLKIPNPGKVVTTT
jgi:hypothetical protein